MSKKQMQVEVSENTHAVVSALVVLAGKVKHQLDDGFQLTQDLAVFIPELINLAGELSKMSQVDDELKEDPAAWVMALMSAGAPLAQLFKKPESPAVGVSS